MPFKSKKTEAMPRGWAVRACLLLLIVSTIGCDQVAKRLATAHLKGAPDTVFLGDTVRLVHAVNRGGFLSLGSELPFFERTALLTAGSGLLLFACAVLALRGRWSGPSLFGLALLMGGGVSNLADRIQYGAVVDFLNVGVGSLRTGIFNVADMAILLGVTLLVAGRLRDAKDPRRQAARESRCFQRK